MTHGLFSSSMGVQTLSCDGEGKPGVLQSMELPQSRTWLSDWMELKGVQIQLSEELN